jgi:hypothetical protein
MIRLITTIALAAILTACGGGGSDNCDDAIEDTIKDVGVQPEEVTRYDADGYHSHSYWWWARGFERTFTWGSNVEGGCETSDYHFSPIR